MKKKFSASVSGKVWWKPFLGLFAGWIASLIAFELSWMRFTPKASLGETFANAGISLCAAFPLLVLSGFFAFFAYSRTINALSLGTAQCRFRGSLYAFSGEYLKGCLLTLLTLGLYLPALIKQTHAYLLHATECEGHRISFKGNTRRLICIFALWFFIPLLVLIGALFLLTGAATAKSPQHIPLAAIPFLYAACLVLFCAALGPFLLFFVSWCCDFKIGKYRLSLLAEPNKATGFISLQLALSTLSLGLYLPIAFLFICGFLTTKLRISEDDTQRGRIAFTGNTLRGFARVWANAMLCVLSFGIWTPWGVSSILRYLAQHTVVVLES